MNAKKQDKLYRAVGWLLLGMAACIAGAACTNTSHTGVSDNLHPDVIAGRDMVRPYYPEVDDLRLVMEDSNDLSRAMTYSKKCRCAYVTTGIVADFAKEGDTGIKLLGCFIVHEWTHSYGAGESEAYAATAECLRKLSAPQYWIDRYQVRV